MCVIIISEKFPSQEILQAAAETNSDGIGIAWREGDQVFWDKGIDLDELQYYKFWTQGPWVFHFRLRTHGSISAALCHPFSIDRRASTDRFGSAEAVLFHNGIYGEALKMMDSFKQHKPGGDWSDTRAMAWLASLPKNKEAIFEFFEKSRQKLVYFTGEELKTFGGGWSEYEGHILSNRHFLWRAGVYDEYYEHYGYGMGPRTGGALHYPGKPVNSISNFKVATKDQLASYHEAWCREVCFCGKDDDEYFEAAAHKEELGLEEEWDIFTHEAPDDHYLRVVECLYTMGIKDEDICEEKLTPKQINDIRNLLYEDEELEREDEEEQSQYLADYMIEGCT